MNAPSVIFYPRFAAGRKKSAKRRRASRSRHDARSADRSGVPGRKQSASHSSDRQGSRHAGGDERGSLIGHDTLMLSYVKRVKRKLADRPDAYRQFVAILGRVGRPESNKIQIISSIIDLLDGYPDLILEFAQFLPPGLEIIKQDDAFVLRVYESAAAVCAFDDAHDDGVLATMTRHQTLTSTCLAATTTTAIMGGNTGSADAIGGNSMRGTRRQISWSASTTGREGRSGSRDMSLSKRFADDDEALAYIRRVKQALERTPQDYARFSEILSAYHGSEMSAREAIESVVKLLQMHPDLVLGFNRFLPPGHRIHMSDDRSYSIVVPASSPNKTQDKIVLHIDKKRLQ